MKTKWDSFKTFAAAEKQAEKNKTAGNAWVHVRARNDGSGRFALSTEPIQIKAARDSSYAGQERRLNAIQRDTDNENAPEI